jgi:hypothetical protein
MKKIFAAPAAALVLALGLSACSSDADVASRNLSQQADNFQVPRRIVFINGITDKYLLTITGYCSLGNSDKSGELTVTCKVGDGYKKNFLGLSDNVTYLVEQLEPKAVSTDTYEVNFKPQSIIPDIEKR